MGDRGTTIIATSSGTLEAWTTVTRGKSPFGRRLWRRTIGPRQAPDLMSSATSVLAAGRTIAAVDPADGSILGHADVLDAHFAGRGHGRALLVGARRGDLAVIDAHDARVIAQRELHDTARATFDGRTILRIDSVGNFVTMSRMRPAPSQPRGLRECESAGSSRFGDPDALPADGETEMQHVQELLDSTRDQIEDTYPGLTRLSVEPRNGAVWTREADGSITTHRADDYWIVARLRSQADCPSTTVSWAGTPIRFLTPSA